jgi:hypothetical protein
MALQTEVKPEDILSKLPSTPSSPEKSDTKWFADAKKESKKLLTLEDRENASIIAMRERWGYYILAFIGLIIGFDMVLVWMYGVGVWNFNDSRVVIAVITENFLKILGLGLVITTQTFKKIFENQTSRQ